MTWAPNVLGGEEVKFNMHLEGVSLAGDSLYCLRCRSSYMLPCIGYALLVPCEQLLRRPRHYKSSRRSRKDNVKPLVLEEHVYSHSAQTRYKQPRRHGDEMIPDIYGSHLVEFPHRREAQADALTWFGCRG